MFKLYYLVNQAGALDGDKALKGVFGSLALAQAQASTDGISHYSVEQIQDLEENECIVFRV